MHVQAEALGQPAQRLDRVVRRQAELRAVVRGLDRLVRVGLDARRDSDQAALRAERACALELVERVEHDQRAGLRRPAQQLVLLVVPVDHEPVAGDAGAARELELADRRDVRAEALLGEELQHRDRREGLRAVDDERAGRRRGVRARLGVERRLVVDDDRRPELAGELRGAHAAEHELAVLDAGGVGKQFAEGAVGQWLHAKPIVTLRAVNLLLT